NVDDSEAARYAKTRVLSRAGYTVLEAESGTEALDKARHEKPDLILLDVKLPDINGFEVCKLLRQDSQTNKILILQTSASFVGSTHKIRALEGGADNYLVEPVEPEELIANVQALLRLGQAESQLRDSEKRFRQIANNVTDVFWMFDCQKRELLYVNPAYEALWQRSIEILQKAPDDWLAVVHADDRVRVEMAYNRFYESGFLEEEYRLVLKDGSLRWIRDRGFPVRDDDSNGKRIARISQDITTSKIYEEQLQETDRKKDEFLATLAHELRNPLGPIRNSVELLNKIAPNPTTMEERARQIILRQANHLVRLVDDLLDVSRITHGKVSLRRLPVELREFVMPAVETAQNLIDARHHKLSVQLPDQRCWVRGDAVRLAQVIGNLLTNAAKFTPAGGSIELTAAIAADKLKVSVLDNGIGVDPERAQHIFDMFAQADHAPDRAPDGLGIGLSLVRKLMDLHGGTVELKSEGVGRGSRFDITLPVLTDREENPRSTTSNSAGEQKNFDRKILVVDDNIDAATTLAALLEADGHQCFVAHDGPTAIGLAQSVRPDVAFLDIGLPGMNGYDVIRSMKSLSALAETVFVALTGYGQQQDKRQASDAGFDHHLVKPVDIKALEALGLAIPH
ncbi:MAG: hybrid sensor histidine kinase/response regulator, partial [Paucimonas sp.]|nr:hybrid sensor histidine kinase/response regulator [Paucimonas sp.]